MASAIAVGTAEDWSTDPHHRVGPQPRPRKKTKSKKKQKKKFDPLARLAGRRQQLSTTTHNVNQRAMAGGAHASKATFDADGDGTGSSSSVISSHFFWTVQVKVLLLAKYGTPFEPALTPQPTGGAVAPTETTIGTASATTNAGDLRGDFARCGLTSTELHAGHDLRLSLHGIGWQVLWQRLVEKLGVAVSRGSAIVTGAAAAVAVGGNADRRVRIASVDYLAATAKVPSFRTTLLPSLYHCTATTAATTATGGGSGGGGGGGGGSVNNSPRGKDSDGNDHGTDGQDEAEEEEYDDDDHDEAARRQAVLVQQQQVSDAWSTLTSRQQRQQHCLAHFQTAHRVRAYMHPPTAYMHTDRIMISPCANCVCVYC